MTRRLRAPGSTHGVTDAPGCKRNSRRVLLCIKKGFCRTCRWCALRRRMPALLDEQAALSFSRPDGRRVPTRLAPTSRPRFARVLRIAVLGLYLAALLAPTEVAVFHQLAIVQSFGRNHGHDFIAHTSYLFELKLAEAILNSSHQCGELRLAHFGYVDCQSDLSGSKVLAMPLQYTAGTGLGDTNSALPVGCGPALRRHLVGFRHHPRRARTRALVSI